MRLISSPLPNCSDPLWIRIGLEIWTIFVENFNATNRKTYIIVLQPNTYIKFIMEFHAHCWIICFQIKDYNFQLKT